MKMIRTELNKTERLLLEWLSKEDESNLGECDGTDLDSLVNLGYAAIRETAGFHRSYSKVSVTDKGWDLLKGEFSPEEQSLAEAIGLGVGGRGVAEY
jgi:hypothetical protein